MAPFTPTTPVILSSPTSAKSSVISDIFHDLLDKYVTIYLDDILIYSDSPASTGSMSVKSSAVSDSMVSTPALTSASSLLTP